MNTTNGIFKNRKWGDLFHYRYVWMTFAILWVMFFHLNVYAGEGLLNRFKNLGYGGVDIFFFATGLGCYRSITNNPDPATFMKKRLSRIMPAFTIHLMIWSLYQLYVGNLTVHTLPLNFLGNLSGMQYLTGKEYSFSWYIPAVMLCYLFMPYLAAVLKNASSTKGLGLLVALTLFSFTGTNSHNWTVITSRVPIFFMGILAEKYLKDKELKLHTVVTTIIVMILGLCLVSYCNRRYPERMWSWGLFWYPFALITPGICVLLSYLGLILEKGKVGQALLKVASFLGKFTFEIFLVHCFAIEVFDHFAKLHLIVSNKYTKLMMIIAIFIAAWLLYKVSEKIRKTLCSR